MIVIGGPTTEYQSNAVASIQKYVEAGGRALILLDPPLKMGKPAIADNDALSTVLAAWGVTLDKDVILDLNPLGQLAGVGPQVALVSKYTFHPIVSEMNGVATGFPAGALHADQKHGQDRRAATLQLLGEQPGDRESELRRPSIPRTPRTRRDRCPWPPPAPSPPDKPDKEGRFVVVGNSQWAANSFIDFNGNSDLAMNAMNWLSSDEDLISIRPKPPEDRQITMTTQSDALGAHLQPVPAAAGRGARPACPSGGGGARRRRCMKTRGLILAAAALAVLAGVLYWSNRREAAKAAAGGTAEAPRIINLNSDDITRINILRNQTEKISLVKLDSGDWQVAETPALPGDSSTISGVLSAVSTLNSDRIVEEKPADLAAYGLAKPARRSRRQHQGRQDQQAAARRQYAGGREHVCHGGERSAPLHRFQLREDHARQGRPGFRR